MSTNYFSHVENVANIVDICLQSLWKWKNDIKNTSFLFRDLNSTWFLPQNIFSNKDVHLKSLRCWQVPIMIKKYLRHLMSNVRKCLMHPSFYRFSIYQTKWCRVIIEMQNSTSKRWLDIQMISIRTHKQFCVVAFSKERWEY